MSTFTQHLKATWERALFLALGLKRWPIPRLWFGGLGIGGLLAGLYFALPVLSNDGGTTLSSQAVKSAILQITPRPLVQYLALVGTIEPGSVVNVTAPFNGPVKARFIDFGMRVKRGQAMLSLDTGDVDLKMRDAEVNVIKAKQKVEELRSWQDGSEVARAKNTTLAAQLKVDELTRKEQENKALLTRGIIPRNEYETVVSELKAQKLQLNAAHQDLTAVLKKGDEEHRHVAALELENATKRRDKLKRQRLAGVIEAPVSGLVLRPPESSNGKDGKQVGLQVGSRLTKGQTLLAIADTETLKVRAQVDEIDVNRIHEDQRVQITGDAFGGAMLMGKVTQISAQANSGGAGRGQSAAFLLVVAIDSIPPDLRGRVRVGMSAKLSVITYESSAALVVPINAVHSGLGGNTVLRHDPVTGQQTRIPVTVGKTLEDGLEILAGLKPGDNIVVEGRVPLQRPLLNFNAAPTGLKSASPLLILEGGGLGKM